MSRENQNLQNGNQDIEIESVAGNYDPSQNPPSPRAAVAPNRYYVGIAMQLSQGDSNKENHGDLNNRNNQNIR